MGTLLNPRSPFHRGHTDVRVPIKTAMLTFQSLFVNCTETISTMTHSPALLSEVASRATWIYHV